LRQRNSLKTHRRLVVPGQIKLTKSILKYPCEDMTHGLHKTETGPTKDPKVMLIMNCLSLLFHFSQSMFPSNCQLTYKLIRVNKFLVVLDNG